jgi:hypothetical protein
MALKNIDTSPRFIAVVLERQLLQDKFEDALNHLLVRELARAVSIPGIGATCATSYQETPENEVGKIRK